MTDIKQPLNNARTEKRSNNYWLIIIWTFAFYVANISTKNLYSAEIIEIIRHFGNVPKAKASLATTFYFVTYAVAQLIISRFIKKLNLLKMLFGATIISICLTAVIPVCSVLWQVYVIFAINGVLQAFTWPTVMYITSHYLSGKYVSKATMLLGVGGSVGYVLDFALSSFFIKYSNWQISFWAFCILYLTSTFGLAFILKKSEKTTEEKGKMTLKATPESQYKVKVNLKLFYFFICIGGFLINVIYYGVQGWITTFLHDNFDFSSSSSALFTTIIPIFSAVGPVLSVPLCEKFGYQKVSAVLISGIAALLLILGMFCNKSVVLFIAIIVVIITVLRLLSVVFSTVILVNNRSIIDIASVAAISNTFISVGAAAGPIFMGSVIDNFGWGTAYFVMTGVSVSVIFLILFTGKKLADIK